MTAIARAASANRGTDSTCAYAIVTFGCRVNQADSLRIEEDLRARGGLERARRADLVVVNTCSVTATADQGARQTIRRIARDNPAARIVVTGCYATRCAGRRRRICRTSLRSCRNDREGSSRRRRAADERRCRRAIRRGRWSVRGADRARRRRPDGVHAAGADRVRGALQLLHHSDDARAQAAACRLTTVVDEVERVAGAGFKEIALTGVHLGSYGRDLTPPASLYDAAARAGRESEPTSCFASARWSRWTARPTIVVADRRERRPLRAALPSAAAARERSDACADAAAVHARLLSPAGRRHHRHAFRTPSIGTDMIVGFPGETDEDFAANVAYLPSSPLSHLHVFPYSDRPGTEASSLPSRVPPSVIRDRGVRMREIGASLARRFREAQVGSLRPGLTLEDGTLVVTDNYLKVRVPPGRARNERVAVRIDRSDGVLEGTIA